MSRKGANRASLRLWFFALAIHVLRLDRRPKSAQMNDALGFPRLDSLDQHAFLPSP